MRFPAMRFKRNPRAALRRRDHTLKCRLIDPPGASSSPEPLGRALGSQRKQRGNSTCPALFERTCRIPKERLSQKEASARTDRREIRGTPWRQEMDRSDSQFFKNTAELILDDVRKCADDQERSAIVTGSRQFRNERRQASILALRKSRLDAAAGIIEDANSRRIRP
jgi:hypothetical protein